jgi:hypothetical protein
MPCEAEEFRRRMDVWHRAYPAMEYGGLVFVYMGPPDMQPRFPMYDVIDTRYRNERRGRYSRTRSVERPASALPQTGRR